MSRDWGLRALGLVVIMLALLLAVSGEAWAERRVALVIGNGAYGHAPALRNPGNDADGIAALLGTLDFEVESGRDLDLAAMQDLIRRFGRLASGADVALVFYAGHGLQVDGENWLLPVDARLEDARDLEFEAVNLTTILRQVEGSAARIVMLDACRDNPLAAQMAMAGTRSVGRGLARVEAANVGTLIAFATSPGATAADGSGRNSPFTAALLEHLGEPGLEVRQVMTRVRQSVVAASDGRQTPWENASLTGEIYLAGLPPVVETAPPGPPGPTVPAAPFDERAVELAFWDAIKDSTSLAAFEAYLTRYPDGTFAPLAQLEITALKAEAKEREKLERETLERERLAKLTPPAQAPEEDKQGEFDALSSEELARILQSELQRVGCYTASVDGKWGPRSVASLKAFNQRAGTRLEGPGAIAIRTARQRSRRVCPLECQRYFESRGETCVRVACPTGQRLSGSRCEAITCPSGQRLQGNSCVAVPRNVWGAIAMAKGGGYGVAWNSSSAGDANQRALNSCRSQRGNVGCSVKHTFSNQCGAIATTTRGNGWGTAVRATRNAAISVAVAGCRNRNPRHVCTLKGSWCSPG